ncbi:MAG: peptidase U62 [bacterium]|nr:peptidase U62 [bacterium]
MKKCLFNIPVSVILLLVPILFPGSQLSGATVPKADGPVLLKAMEDELSRSMEVLGRKGTPAPYYISYQVTERNSVSMSASFGSLRHSRQGGGRILDVAVRVGSRRLDNSHRQRGHRFEYSYDPPLSISIEDDMDAIKSALWLETDRRYKEAAEKLIKVKSIQKVSVKEDDLSFDFSEEEPVTFNGQAAQLPDHFRKEEWIKRIKDISALFNGYPWIHRATVSLHGSAENKYFIGSEGTRLRHGRNYWRLSIIIRTVAEDGMQLYKSKAFDAAVLENLPSAEVLVKTAERLRAELLQLRNAPLMEPFTGPAILSGEASAVFFHEIFGHRIEGHRQKDEKEGQTFSKMIDKQVLPTFLSIYDDPSLKKYGTRDLHGHYLYDDQGVKGQRVNLVENGILKSFLMSRSPVEGFPKSNGHGRAQQGMIPVSRQGNLVLTSSQTVPMEELRKILIRQCKKQGKDYGLYLQEVSGGVTNTMRYRPQAFSVKPITVFKIFTDGRPDQLVRGVTLIGTPLTSFSKIIACADKPGIFNGYCGAESGRVPVSAIALPILTDQIEVQKKPKSTNKPPVLEAPEETPTGTDVKKGESK